MGVWGLLGVSFISFYITVTDSFLLRNERNPQNHPNPQHCERGSASRPRDDRARSVLKKKFARHQKGKELRKLFPGLPGVYEVL
jgi:hypothetical protein